MEILEEFGDVSGWQPNLLKSDLYFAGIDAAHMEDIREITGLSFGTMPFCYLGVPIAAHVLQFSHFGTFLKKFIDCVFLEL